MRAVWNKDHTYSNVVIIIVVVVIIIVAVVIIVFISVVILLLLVVIVLVFIAGDDLGYVCATVGIFVLEYHKFR